VIANFCRTGAGRRLSESCAGDASSKTEERSSCSCDGWREKKREAGICSGCSERGRKEAGGESRKNSDRKMGGGGLGDGEKSEEIREVERGI
jgi:hypothetical protein